MTSAAAAIRPLESAHVHATAAVLASAFDDDPAYRFLFPEAHQRPRGLRDFFTRNLQTHLPYRCTSALFDGGEVIGTATLRPPEGFSVSLLTMLRRGLIPFGLANGASAVRRLFALKSTYDDLEARLARGAPHWYLHMMAIAPSRQGQGVGSRLLEHVLSTTLVGAQRAGSAPVVLTTHQERNVVFYERAGFAVTEVRTVSILGEPPYPVWSMRQSR